MVFPNDFLILDGGMGTTLQAMGLPPGGVPELLNLEQPEMIAAVHRAYAEAGAQVVYTNTFGANGLKLKRIGRTVDEIVSAASSYARSRDAIDIEIDTVKAERRRGLASAAAAGLILQCLDEGLYPAWDAANKMSVRLTEKLGYEFSREYVCYGLE